MRWEQRQHGISDKDSILEHIYENQIFLDLYYEDFK